MTGAEHYAEAERLLAEAAEHVNTPRIGVSRTLAEMAQAHATLASAAATALPIDSLENRAEWLEVLSS
jgi:hypothetical protein